MSKKVLNGNLILDFEEEADFRFGDKILHISVKPKALMCHIKSYFCQFNAVDTNLQDCSSERDISFFFSDVSPEAFERELSGIVFMNHPHRSVAANHKDFYELSGRRVIRKRERGLLFLFSEKECFVFGNVSEHPSQLVNAIVERLLQNRSCRGDVMLHAAAFRCPVGNTVAICGPSGSGKTTLLLRLLESCPNSTYISNDRLLYRLEKGKEMVTGQVKFPRANPGTLLNNPSLQHLVHSDLAEICKQMTFEELWSYENKADLIVTEEFECSFGHSFTELTHVVILNWSHKEKVKKCAVREVELSKEGIASFGSISLIPPGLFFLSSFLDGRREQEDLFMSYMTKSNVKVFEAVGGVDFASLVNWVHENIL